MQGYGAEWRDGRYPSYARGHPIILADFNHWVYADTLMDLDENRPCARCGRAPTPEGYDACLGHIDGVVGACCGHGIEGDAYIYTAEERMEKIRKQAEYYIDSDDPADRAWVPLIMALIEYIDDLKKRGDKNAVQVTLPAEEHG